MLVRCQARDLFGDLLMTNACGTGQGACGEFLGRTHVDQQALRALQGTEDGLRFAGDSRQREAGTEGKGGYQAAHGSSPVFTG